jgi:hypothetical protein
MMVLRHILAVLCEVFSFNITYNDQSPRSADLNPLDFCLWGHRESLVCATSAANEEIRHHSIVDARQAIRNYPGYFERMQRSMMRRIEALLML